MAAGLFRLRSPVGWLRSRDPGWRSSRRAVQSAIAVPAAFAIAVFVGAGQSTVFAAFGAFALLLFAEFTGDRRTRARSYASLVITGAVLISLASLLYAPIALAVAAMLVVGFAMLFVSVVSSTLAAGNRAVVLVFILPLTFPGGLSMLPDRLLGWGIAAALAVPANLFLLTPKPGGGLRHRAAQLARDLAALLTVSGPAAPVRGLDDASTAVQHALSDLQSSFWKSATRPVNLNTGSRLLAELIEQLGWVTTTVLDAGGVADGRNPDEQYPDRGYSDDRLRGAGSHLPHAAAAALCAIAHAVEAPDSDEAEQALRVRQTELDEARRAAQTDTVQLLRRRRRDTGAGADARAADLDPPMYTGHELGFAVAQTLSTVRVMVAAERRSWWSTLLGRAPTPSASGEVTAARALLVHRLSFRSVAFQSSLRGAVGLAAAVLLARVLSVQEGFWIVLGALSVLRSNAVSTGGTAVRAVAGTAVGVAIGAGIVVVIGADPIALWLLLPVAVLVAASLSDVIGFVAGQVGFTVMVIILFNLIMASGAGIGVVRIENVALGCGASLIAGVLLWPRGALPELTRTLEHSYRSAADLLTHAVGRLTGVEDRPGGDSRAQDETRRLDDAFRQYAADRGRRQVPVEKILELMAAAGRLRFAAIGIESLCGPRPVDAAATSLQQPVNALRDRTTTVTDWYRAAGRTLASDDRHPPGHRSRHHGDPDPDGAGTDGARPDGDEWSPGRSPSLLDAIAPAAGDEPEDRRSDAERLVWAAEYLQDVDRLRSELVAPIRELAAVRRPRMRHR